MDDLKTVLVLQREIGITRASAPKPILATTNVAMCVTFHGYNEQYKTGFLCHFDFPHCTSSLHLLAEKLVCLTGRDSLYECSIYGGRKWTWARSQKIKDRLKLETQRINQISGIKFNIVEVSRLQTCRERLAYALDTRDGKIYPYPQRFCSMKVKNLFRSPEIVYEPSSIY